MNIVISILVILFLIYLIGIMVRSLIDKTKYCLADLQRPDFRKLWTPIIDFEESFQFYSIGIILLAGISGGIFVASLIGKNDFRTVTFIASMTLLSAAIGQNLVIIFFVQKIIGRFDRSDGSIALMVLCLVFGFVELLGFIRSFYVHFVW